MWPKQLGHDSDWLSDDHKSYSPADWTKDLAHTMAHTWLTVMVHGDCDSCVIHISPKIQTHLMTVWNFGGGGSERCCCLLGRQCRQQALALHIALMVLLTWRPNDGNLIKFVSFYLSGLSVVVYTPYVAHNPPLKLASVRTSAESPPYL